MGHFDTWFCLAWPTSRTGTVPYSEAAIDTMPNIKIMTYYWNHSVTTPNLPGLRLCPTKCKQLWSSQIHHSKSRKYSRPAQNPWLGVEIGNVFWWSHAFKLHIKSVLVWLGEVHTPFKLDNLDVFGCRHHIELRPKAVVQVQTKSMTVSSYPPEGGGPGDIISIHQAWSPLFLHDSECPR